MCIANSVYQKNKLIAKTKRFKKKTIKVWKTLRVSEIGQTGELESRMYPYIWKSGKHGHFRKECEKYRNGLRMRDEGFYVFLKKPTRINKQDGFKLVKNVVIVPLYANINDLLAVGSKIDGEENIAVFSKLVLKQKDYDKAVSSND